jgi:hypothetical protein
MGCYVFKRYTRMRGVLNRPTFANRRQTWAPTGFPAAGLLLSVPLQHQRYSSQTLPSTAAAKLSTWRAHSAGLM